MVSEIILIHVHVLASINHFLYYQNPEIRKYKRKFTSEILCGALWGVNLLVGTDNGLMLLDRSGHGKGDLSLTIHNVYIFDFVSSFSSHFKTEVFSD